MRWIPKMHKNPVGAHFIIASKICATKQISKFVSNVFKFVYSHIENFHKNTKFFSNYSKFWVLQNSDPTIQSLNYINKKTCQIYCNIRLFDIIYKATSHDKLKSKFSSIVDFAFKGGTKLLLDCLIMVQHSVGRKQKGDLVLIKKNRQLTSQTELTLHRFGQIFFYISMKKIHVITNFF